jgi:hypothetical protein
MKKALVCPNEPVENGYRIAQVELAENIFDVADPMYWFDCNDDVAADLWYFNVTENLIKEVPKPIRIAATNQPITTGSQTI